MPAKNLSLNEIKKILDRSTRSNQQGIDEFNLTPGLLANLETVYGNGDVNENLKDFSNDIVNQGFTVSCDTRKLTPTVTVNYLSIEPILKMFPMRR